MSLEVASSGYLAEISQHLPQAHARSTVARTMLYVVRLANCHETSCTNLPSEDQLALVVDPAWNRE